jgi:hypothetical protein
MRHCRKFGRYPPRRWLANANSGPLEVTAMSSPEELTFVLGRWLRPIVVVLDVVLDVVRRLGLRTTSSREQRSTALNQ